MFKTHPGMRENKCSSPHIKWSSKTTWAPIFLANCQTLSSQMYFKAVIHSGVLSCFGTLRKSAGIHLYGISGDQGICHPIASIFWKESSLTAMTTSKLGSSRKACATDLLLLGLVTGNWFASSPTKSLKEAI